MRTLIGVPVLKKMFKNLEKNCRTRLLNSSIKCHVEIFVWEIFEQKIGVWETCI